MNKKYIDQNGTELYDAYDAEANEETPKMLSEAQVLIEGKYTDKVKIDYPVINNIWTLDGDKGSTPFYSEVGKKAFVRKGFYAHPFKGWSSLIVTMTPLEYIEEAARLFSKKGQKVKAEDLISGRLEDYDLNEVFNPLKGDLFYPMIDRRYGSQEGLHRAVWAMMNEEESIPVVIIEK